MALHPQLPVCEPWTYWINTRASGATADNQIIIGTGAAALTSGGATRFTVGDGSNNSHISFECLLSYLYLM